MRSLLALLLAAAVPAGALEKIPDGRKKPVVAPKPGEVVYGTDDRREPEQVIDPRLKALTQASVALFRASDVSVKGKTAQLSLFKRPKMSPKEPFVHQRAGAYCSAALVAPELILTARHCVKADCKAVFGFIAPDGGASPTSVPAGDVYDCTELFADGGKAADWALLHLDRPVTGRTPMVISGERVKSGTPLAVVGYPHGLPVKIAGNAVAIDEGDPVIFKANLDTYHGNSGSPVLDERDWRVVGILSDGQDDYVLTPAGRLSDVRPDNDVMNETLVRAALALPFLGSPAKP